MGNRLRGGALQRGVFEGEQIHQIFVTPYLCQMKAYLHTVKTFELRVTYRTKWIWGTDFVRDSKGELFEGEQIHQILRRSNFAK